MAFDITKIKENLYQFNECRDYGDGIMRPYVDAYLYIGTTRAALIDVLQESEDVYEKVRELTDLPVDVLITHGHLDHAGKGVRQFAEAGCRIYMDLSDMKILCGMVEGTDPSWFLPLAAGDHFNLGDKELTTVACAGHTPGSVVFFDRDNKLLFSGDTVGSGAFWMQIPGALPIRMFEENVKKLLDYLVPFGLDDILVYPGHRNQSPIQLTGRYVRDCWHISQGIVSGTIVGTEKTIDMPGRHMEFLEVSYGQMVSYCYDPEQINFPKKLPEVKAYEEGIKDLFTQENYRNGVHTMDYMLYTPKLEEGCRYPLVLFLHGGGEKGSDPRRALANNGGWIFAEESWQKKHPCYIIAPQVADGHSWNDEVYTSMLRDLIMGIGMKLQVDPARVYITGLSMGSMGTWKMLSLYPDLFAAALPICGCANPFEVRNAVNVPVWAAHAEDDPVVKVTGLQKMPLLLERDPSMVGTRMLVNSLKGAGNPNVHYTEYPAGYMAEKGMHAHASWVPTYENEEIKEWLFAQTRVNQYQIHMVAPGFYHIEDFNDDSIYIVEGTERALVVDTGLADNDFMAMVRSVTNLPVDLAVTHCHGDHCFHIDKFERFYMSPEDYPLFERGFLKNPALSEEKRAAYAKAEFIPAKEGDIIDLGGGYEIEVVNIFGHTPGSVLFLDKKRGYGMIGDATGVWMQVPGALGIRDYKRHLEHFLEYMSRPEYAGVVFMNGHRKQEDASFRYGKDYTPNDLQKVRDMITLCGLLLEGLIPYEKYMLQLFGETAYCASYGQANLVFDMTHLNM